MFRIRICQKSTVHDFHLLSIAVHERHTGETIFNTFAKAMHALFPDWREAITGASSDGEKKMTGRHQGVITRIHRVAKPGFMRVWCGAHQLDLCMQSFYLAIPDTFYSTFTLLVAYLRWQQNFISDERSQCSLICNTRWLNIVKVTTWFDRHRLAVVAYLEEKEPNCMPDDSWWILMLFVHEIAGIAAISCKSLQRHGALLRNQHHTLQRLVLEINNKVGIVGILMEAHAARSTRRRTSFLIRAIMRSHSLTSVALWRTWACSSKTASPQWTAGIVRHFYDCQHPPSANWWMALPPLLGENRRQRGLYRRGSGCSTPSAYPHSAPRLLRLSAEPQGAP
jgi:hypothetical protein